jgi:hypothetical protein
MFLKGSTCLCHVPFGVPPNGMTTEASSETRARAAGRCNRDGRAPRKKRPSHVKRGKPQRYVKEQAPNVFEASEHRYTCQWSPCEDFSLHHYKDIVRHYPYLRSDE